MCLRYVDEVLRHMRVVFIGPDRVPTGEASMDNYVQTSGWHDVQRESMYNAMQGVCECAYMISSVYS